MARRNSLDDVLIAGQNYMNISAIMENFKKDYTDPDNFNNFAQYTARAGPIEQEDFSIMMGELRKDPFKMREVVESSKKADKKQLITIVGDKYNEILNELKEESLLSLAMEIPNKDSNRDFKKIEKYIEAREFDKVKKAYADSFGNSVWKKFIELSDGQFIQRYAARYVQRQKNNFLEQFLTKNGDKAKIDEKKVRKYIKDSIGKYKDYEDDADKDDVKKKFRDKAYELIGKTYFMQRVQEYRKEVIEEIEKKKDKKKLKKDELEKEEDEEKGRYDIKRYEEEERTLAA